MSSINTNPPGKIIFTQPFDHYRDSEDPHGSELIQTNLTVLDIYSGDELLEAVNLQFSGVAVAEDIDFHNINANQMEFLGAQQMITNVTNVAIFSGVSLIISGGSTWGGNVSLLSGKTIDGQDPSVRGAQLDGHLVNYNNPHQLTIDMISGLASIGGTLSGNLAAQSGVLVDGIDLSTILPLLNGSTIPNSIHFHQRPRKTQNVRDLLVPEFEGVIFSGSSYTFFDSNCDSVHNYYSFSGTPTYPLAMIFIRHQLDEDFENLNNIKLYHKGSDGTSPYIELSVYDSQGNECTQSGGKGLKAAAWTQATISNIGGSFQSGTAIGLKILMGTPSGSEVKVGEIMVDFNRAKVSTI